MTVTMSGTYSFALTVGDGDHPDSDSGSVTVRIKPGESSITSLAPNPSETGSYTVKWSGVPNISAYQLDESYNNNAWKQVYSGTGTSKAFSGKANGHYRYKVRSHNSAGYSAWSATQTETVNQTPGVPTAFHYRPLGTLQYQVQWTAPAYGTGITYKLEKSSNRNFSPATTQSAGQTSVTENYGRFGAHHYYRVRACHGSYCSGWTNTLEVTDPSGGGVGCHPLCPPPHAPNSAPTGQATPSKWRMMVHYSYDSFGDLASVYGPDATSPYWKLATLNAAGQVIEAHEASGANTLTRSYDAATGELTEIATAHGAALVFDEQYGYDRWGERTQRKDVLNGQIENYSYSPAARLTRAKLATGSKAVTLSASYDRAGNLKTKADRGGSLGYTYGQSTHPNRLTTLAVSGSYPGIAGGGLTYDAAGRIRNGAGYSITYNRRGLTATIARGSDTASLAYAPDGHRYAMTVDGKTTLYLAGGAFRIVEEAGGVIAYRQAILAGGMMVAQQTTRSDASSGFEYFYHDGLGSPVAFASFTGVGTPPGVAYAPYGRARNPSNWATLDTGNPLAAYGTRRGYTGGESLAKLGVVVLGARVYVPALGRWLSPDPAGAGSPYVYADDNPVGATDPTGEFTWQETFSAVIIGFIAYATGGVVASPMATGSAVAGGAAGGFTGGFISSGGSWRDGAIGAASGAAMAYIGGLSEFGGANPTATQLAEKATVEGLVAGTLSAAANGGSGRAFESGFLGAFAAAEVGGGIEPNSTSGEMIALRTAAMTVVGGTVAEIGGGDFANGAISAAFQQLFNAGLDEKAKAEISFSYKSKGLGKFAQAVKTYGLKKKFATVFPKGSYTINVRLDASIAGDDADMETPNATTILVNPAAISRHANILAAEIGHELVHVNDWLRGSLYTGMSSKVEAASEVRAYSWEFNAKFLKLPLSYKTQLATQIVKYELLETEPSTH